MANELVIERLGRLINQAGISRREFAAQAGIPAGTVSSWFLKGVKRPRYDYLISAARTLNVTVDYLTGKIDDEDETRLGVLFGKLERKINETIVDPQLKSDVEGALNLIKNSVRPND